MRRVVILTADPFTFDTNETLGVELERIRLNEAGAIHQVPDLRDSSAAAWRALTSASWMAPSASARNAAARASISAISASRLTCSLSSSAFWKLRQAT